MKSLAIAGVMLFGIILSGCASFPKDDIEIETEADPKVNFSAYKTYAWLGTAQILADPEGKWEPPGFDADAEITALIDAQLAKRGMSQADTYPDMLVAYALGLDMATIRFEDDPDTDVRVLENVPKGALVVILLDPETEFIMWAAVAVADIKNAGDEITRKRMNYTITKMFRQLPK